MLFKKSYGSLIAKIFIISVLFISMAGCQNDDKQKDTQNNGANQVNQAGQTVNNLQMSCLKLTKAQVQAWVDSGWTNPGNPSTLMTRIMLQFYSGDADTDSNMQLISYPATSYTNVYVNGKAILEKDTSCVAMSVTGPVILANNFIGFKSLKITNPDGSLKDFSFIRFKPARTFAPYLNFEMEVVRIVGTKEEILSAKGSDPCPPYCPDEESFQ